MDKKGIFGLTRTAYMFVIVMVSAFLLYNLGAIPGLAHTSPTLNLTESFCPLKDGCSNASPEAEERKIEEAPNASENQSTNQTHLRSSWQRYMS